MKSFLILILMSLQSIALQTPALYFSPSARHQEIIEGINAARKTIHMVIFHLNDREVEDALISAQGRGVKVQMIVDRLSLHLPPFAASKKRLEKGRVSVTPSPEGFKITHQKSMVVDDEMAYITTMNLTLKVTTTRDWGYITKDKDVIHEMDAVFMADLKNAADGTSVTPPLKNPNLVWSPINAKEKIVGLIASARGTLTGTVENLGSPEIQKAFIEAAARGVKIRFITPLCNIAMDPAKNVSFSKELTRGSVDARLMPDPATANQPYMHAKTLVIDSKKAFIGSENFSNNSLTNAREAGIIFTDAAAIKMLEREFEKDWAQTVKPDGPLPSCR